MGRLTFDPKCTGTFWMVSPFDTKCIVTFWQSRLILLEFVAVIAVAWKNVLLHFWWSRLILLGFVAVVMVAWKNVLLHFWRSRLILLEFVAVVAVAWKNVLLHFWRSQLLNVLQQNSTPCLTITSIWSIAMMEIFLSLDKYPAFCKLKLLTAS